LQSIANEPIDNIVILASCRYLESGEMIDLKIPFTCIDHIALGALDEHTSQHMICNLLDTGTLPQKTLNWIVEKSSGNPLFIEQIISFLKENACFDASFNLNQNIDELQSFTITDIIGNRIDSLTENVRNTLQHACILGMEFNTTILSEMLTRELRPELNSGKKARVWSDLDHLTYIFSHVLIKDTAYHRMLSEKLRKLHVLAAETMIKLQLTEDTTNHETIAFHYERAEVWDRAREYYLKAAINHSQKFSFSASEQYFQVALQLNSRLYDDISVFTAEILVHYEEMVFNKGDLRSSLATSERIKEIYEATIGMYNEKYVVALIRL